MFYAVSNEYKSLRKISNEAQKELSLYISKQGLDNRFSQTSVDFSRRLLEQALNNQFREAETIVMDPIFKRILIKDSTRFDIDKSLKEYYPSYGGKTSVAGVSVQLEYDLKTGKINDLDVQSALDRDSTDALKKLELVKAGDLIIRDLGYFHTEVLEYINDQNAYFLTRLQATTKVFLTKDGNESIDFSKIYRQLTKTKCSHLDLDVFVGSKKRLPMRMVIALMPDEIYKKRIHSNANDNRNRGYMTSQYYKDRAHLNIFLTNIPIVAIKSIDICRLYSVRWQIELIFKTWKSLIRISDLRKMKYERLQTTINMKLLWVIIHWEIIQPYRNYLYKTENRILSIFKCVATMQENAITIRQTLKLNKEKFVEHLNEFYILFTNNHWLERRKNKEYYGDLIALYI